MTEVKEHSHKSVAMQFLLSANNDLETPISNKTVEKVYDLFAEQNSEVQNFQKGLQKIINL
jgi:hypothetical protein